MKKYVAGLVLFAASMTSTNADPASSVATPGEITQVPKGTIVVVSTRRSYKSYGNSTGSKVSYDVVQDVVVDGHVVAKAGDTAEGKILNAEHGSTNWLTLQSNGANLRLSVDTLFTFCGSELAADFTRTEYRKRQGMFGEKMDVEVSKGQKYLVATDRTQRVCSEKTDEQQAAIPTDALAADKN